jgi:hypothetical protein
MIATDIGVRLPVDALSISRTVRRTTRIALLNEVASRAACGFCHKHHSTLRLAVASPHSIALSRSFLLTAVRRKATPSCNEPNEGCALRDSRSQFVYVNY